MNSAVEKLQRIAAEVPSIKVVPDPLQPAPQPDRPYVVALRLDFNNTGAVDVARQLREKVGIDGDQPGEIANGKVRLYVIGQGALGAAATEATKHDIAEAEQWNLPIVLIVLLAVFGSLAAAAMPLALGICTVVVTMGMVYLLSMYTTMSVFVTSTVSMFGIALAIDYSLFILMRFREELRAGRDPQQATDAAMATSGLAVVLSGLTVIASVTGIYIIDTPVLASMATGAILAVAVAVLTSTTLTPAVLATFGRAAAKRSSLAALVAAGGDHRVAVLDPLGRLGDATAMAVGAGRHRVPAGTGRSGVLDGAGQQHAAPVRAVPRDPRRCRRGGRGARPRRAGPDPRAGHVPRRGRRPHRPTAGVDAVRQKMGRRLNVVSVSPPVFSDDNRRALLRRCSRSTRRTWRPATPSTGCAQQLPQVPGADAATSTSVGRRR